MQAPAATLFSPHSLNQQNHQINPKLEEANPSTTSNTNSFKSFVKLEDTKLTIELPTKNKSMENPNVEESTLSHNEFLAFCTKLSKLVCERFPLQRGLIQEMIKFNSKIILTLTYPLKLKQIEPRKLDGLQTECLLILWKKFRLILAQTINNKMDSIQVEDWNILFQKKSFTEALEKIYSELLECCNDAELKTFLRNCAFREIFSRMLFTSNKMFVLMLILKDNAEHGWYTREFQRTDNFILLIFYPEYYRFYSHENRGFALDCCNKCKECCYSIIAEGFLLILGEAKKKKDRIIGEVHRIIPSQEGNVSFEGMIKIMNCFYNWL